MPSHSSMMSSCLTRCPPRPSSLRARGAEGEQGGGGVPRPESGTESPCRVRYREHPLPRAARRPRGAPAPHACLRQPLPSAGSGAPPPPQPPPSPHVLLVTISLMRLDALPAMPAPALASDLLRASDALTSTTRHPSSLQGGGEDGEGRGCWCWMGGVVIGRTRPEGTGLHNALCVCVPGSVVFSEGEARERAAARAHSGRRSACPPVRAPAQRAARAARACARAHGARRPFPPPPGGAHFAMMCAALVLPMPGGPVSSTAFLVMSLDLPPPGAGAAGRQAGRKGGGQSRWVLPGQLCPQAAPSHGWLAGLIPRCCPPPLPASSASLGRHAPRPPGAPCCARTPMPPPAPTLASSPRGRPRAGGPRRPRGRLTRRRAAQVHGLPLVEPLAQRVDDSGVADQLGGGRRLVLVHPQLLRARPCGVWLWGEPGARGGVCPKGQAARGRPLPGGGSGGGANADLAVRACRGCARERAPRT